MNKYERNIKYQRHSSRSHSEREEKVLWTTESRLRHERHEYIKEGDKLTPRKFVQSTEGEVAPRAE